MSLPAVDRYAQHAERFGSELVFETAAGLGLSDGEFTITELIALARRLQVIDPKFSPARPDPLVELTGVEFSDAYHDRIAPVLDALAALVPTPRPPVPVSSAAGRRCEWCGKAIAGRAGRRTCSPAHRRALARAGGQGPYSRGVSVTSETETTYGSHPPENGAICHTYTPDPQVTLESRFLGVGGFREVPAGVDQLELFEGAPTA